MNKSDTEKIYWKGICAFIAVARSGSFSAAAEASGNSKSNLSQQVSQLEQLLNVQLLHRTTRQLRLTEIGQGYLEKCQIAVQQLSLATEWAIENRSKLAGEIKMNAVGGLIGEEVIAPLLIEFQQAYPDIDVKLDFSSQRVDLLSSPYDLVMRMGELEDSSLIARRLHTISTKYVASPSFLQRYGSIEHPSDLTHCPLIYGSVSEWRFHQGETQVSVRAEQGFQIANGRVMLKAALEGQGIARLADVYVEPYLANGELLEVLPLWHPSDTRLSLVSPPARYQLNRVRALMDYLIEHFSAKYQQVMLRT
ncbi:LysR family transcriptional regulator [Corallincola platygyrae]|uniref:LysR family transcriptional regulator n=1 Tax=Corallincola platygyrae TaxID=1193278 RepID=A0ABW4XVJ3_9GAMM